MERQALKFQHICLLSALLVLSAGANLFLFLSSSQWGLVFRSDVKGQVIPEATMVAEWPITAITLKKLLQNEPLDVKTFKVDVKKGSRLDPQVRRFQELKDIPDASVNKVRFAFFFDLNHRDLAKIERPYLYVNGSFSPLEVYINGQLVKSVGRRITSLISTPIVGDAEVFRVVFVFENAFSGVVAGPNFFSNGLTVQSESELDTYLSMRPVQMQFLRIVSTVCLIVFGLIAMVLGFSAREYIDIWAYSSFCIAAGLYSWSFTPMFYLVNGKDVSTYRMTQSSFGTAITLSAVILTLGYFRLEGRHFKVAATQARQFSASVKTLLFPFRAILAMTVMSCMANYLFVRPWEEGKNTLTPYTHYQEFNSNLVWILLFSQVISFVFGFASLFRVRQHLAALGLKAQVVLISRRIMQGAVFAVGMAMMLVVYGIGFSSINRVSGNDIYIAGSIFPALVMLLMFFVMVSSGQRFYKKFTPRLGQIDHEVMAFGAKALEKRYHGVLMVFDVAGMKALNILRLTNKRFESAIDALIGQIESDLSTLVQTGRVTFRYKSNGDEFIFAIWATDAAHAQAQFAQLMTTWRECSAGLIDSWKSKLNESISGAEFRATVDMLDLHVMACTMRDIKITVKGGIENPTAAPDFFDPRFTQLSALFKPSRWNKVAMFKDDAGMLTTDSTVYRANANAEMGFWEFGPKESERSTSLKLSNW